MSVSKAEVVIAATAAHQHGTFSRRQVLAAGGSDDLIERRLATGAWHRVAAGVYAVAGSVKTWRRELSAACLEAGPEAVASHNSAGALWGLGGFSGNSVLVPGRHDAPTAPT